MIKVNRELPQKSPCLTTFVLLPLFQSGGNRETSTKCKKGSFLKVLPKTADVTTLSFPGSACQDSDSLPFFPLSPPPMLLTKLPPKKEEKEDLPLDEGKNVSAAHLQLLPSSSPSLAAFL